MSKTCVFIGGKQIGTNCLRYLVSLGVRPSLVVCNRDDHGTDFAWHESLLKYAREQGLETMEGVKVSDPETTKRIKDASPDIIFCIGGTQIIPKEVLGVPRLGCLNLHPALLPKYRGRYSTVHAIFNGETIHGVTAHWMDEGIDSGPVILQESFPITEEDTGKTVYDKFTVLGTGMFKKIVDLWMKGESIPSHPQDESQATYYPKGLPNNGEIDWSWDGTRIRNFIRAMTFEPFPPASFKIGDKNMVIVDEKYFKKFE